jgi:hypothetical protein
MARVPKKSSTQTAPPMDKLLKPAVGVAIAMLGYYVMKGSEWMVGFFCGLAVGSSCRVFCPHYFVVVAAAIVVVVLPRDSYRSSLVGLLIPSIHQNLHQ